jgi:regulator of replication initiation timing
MCDHGIAARFPTQNDQSIEENTPLQVDVRALKQPLTKHYGKAARFPTQNDQSIEENTPLQVDVRALKQSLWHIMGEQHDSHRHDPTPDSGLSFQKVLSSLSADNSVDNLADLSVHLCFICTLHLANEHGLSVTGVPTLDAMSIGNVPTASVV